MGFSAARASARRSSRPSLGPLMPLPSSALCPRPLPSPLYVLHHLPIPKSYYWRLLNHLVDFLLWFYAFWPREVPTVLCIVLDLLASLSSRLWALPRQRWDIPYPLPILICQLVYIKAGPGWGNWLHMCKLSKTSGDTPFCGNYGVTVSGTRTLLGKSSIMNACWRTFAYKKIHVVNLVKKKWSVKFLIVQVVRYLYKWLFYRNHGLGYFWNHSSIWHGDNFLVSIPDLSRG